MAEALGVVASVVQLLGCVQQLHIFFKSIRDVPEDMKAKLEEIEYYREFISQAVSTDRNISASGYGILQSSLENCEAATSALQSLITRIIEPLNKRSHLKPVHLIKAVLKKEEIKEPKEKMDSARHMLQLALICNNTYGWSHIEVRDLC